MLRRPATLNESVRASTADRHGLPPTGSGEGDDVDVMRDNETLIFARRICVPEAQFWPPAARGQAIAVSSQLRWRNAAVPAISAGG